MAMTPPTVPTPATPATPATRSTSSAPATTSTRLGCGRDVDEVWDRIGQLPSEHEQSCPYCTRARSDLAGLAVATRELTAADRVDPALQVSDRMLADVLAIVRTEVRRGLTIPLQRHVQDRREEPSSATGNETITMPASAEGDDAAGPTADLTVSEQVIAAVVRAVCDQNPDVEVGRVSIQVVPAAATGSTTTGAHPAADTGERNRPAGPDGPGRGDLEPTEVSVTLQASVRHAVSIPLLVDGLRDLIRSAVTTHIGVSVLRIDIEIKDLIDV